MIRVADLFCGAGGSSSGLARACDDLGVSMSLTAVNHWDVAISTHAANHPAARHWCMDIDRSRPYDLVPKRQLDILWGSPSCTEHSYAKGGNDVDDQMRVSAWAIPRLAEALRPKIIIVENVPPFRNWGPVEAVKKRNGALKLDKNGQPIRRPIKGRKGETFRAWFSAIESLGYTGDWRLLNAADYGEAQTRIRWFGVFTAPGVRYEWPAETHARRGDPSLLGDRAPWRSAREIIDLGRSERSIFDPVFGRMQNQYLSPNTIRRIVKGVVRYCSEDYRAAFLVVLRRHADALSLDEPLPTVVAGGMHLAVCEPSVTPFVGGNRMNNVPVDIDAPAPTVTTAHGGGLFVAEPLFVLGQHGGSVARLIDGPIPTVATDGAISLVEPFVEPFVVDVDDPIPTVTTTMRGMRFIEPFLALLTSSTPVDRIVEIDGKPYVVDVLFRMLQPYELARAQGFSDDYVFTGSKSDQTTMIGNAVPEKVAYALGRAALVAIGAGKARVA